MRRPAVIQLAVLIAIISLAAVSHRVMGSAAQTAAENHRVASIDLLTLLEDFLRTDKFQPDRDSFREQWETRLNDGQTTLQQLEGELRMASPGDPNSAALQQRYQQAAYQYQRMQQEASMAFDRFSAGQAADAYSILQAEARALAKERGFSHLIVSRAAPEIADRGNLATVTQEILARPLLLSPEGNDLTSALREKLSIPEPADDAAAPGAEVVGPTPAGGEQTDQVEDRNGGDSTEDNGG